MSLIEGGYYDDAFINNRTWMATWQYLLYESQDGPVKQAKQTQDPSSDEHVPCSHDVLHRHRRSFVHSFIHWSMFLLLLSL